MTETALPPLIQQMLEPTFYPHPVFNPATIPGDRPRLETEEFYPAAEPPVLLLQTHVSYVLLTGDYAYKLKKPVNFGFLDYSTLEKRKHFCEEELRLNQRSAAELYLEVVPITKTDDHYQLGGEGEPVEYVVKMRQFPQDTLLTALYDRGELTEELLEQLAKELAAFHRQAATSDYIRSFGTVEQIRQAIDENYEQTEKYVGGPQTQAQLDATRAYTDRLFAERADIFADRVTRDLIRECHGDVHLRNIAYWQDRIWLFDCIEFNEPFRFVDVMFDIAYIVMDLDARDRRDLSNRFLNAYLEQMGDWQGLQVLPLYLSRQSYVRAKVTSFLLDDPSVPEAAKQEAKETAARYYRLAWEYTQRPTQGKLLLMSGLSGSGKSTTARYLAQTLNAIHIRSDAVRKHLVGISLSDRGGDEIYTPEMTQKTYNRLLQLGTTLAAEGYTVILDAKYDQQALRGAAIAQATEQQIPLTIVHCHAPVETLKERLNQRTGDIADATTEVMLKQVMEPFDAEEQPHVLLVDTTQPLPEQLSSLI
ncbi:MAG TPA: AAA family ATPase [Leptolyngbyaceae cyanobacterium M33_DOE_097]|uniref:gluconokinase n=1 Tax=Oscillatoriales cyanobacterium SpSt-418 TaxID=2282169 RepID=A0A7C3PLW0_9CYAN|nr:AAA family ATPase [Leptolyngbyaceae cyanobacterium M33_DOE_097]